MEQCDEVEESVPERKKPKLEVEDEEDNCYEILNLTDLILETSTEEKCFALCQHFLILPKSRICPKCYGTITKISTTRRYAESAPRYDFRCNKRSCRVKIPLKKDTWFGNSNISIRKSLVLIYCFVYKFEYQSAIRETSGRHWNNKSTSTETVADVYSYCRGVCADILYLGNLTRKIGGENSEVEIIEAEFGNRTTKKCDKGISALAEVGQWVVGGFCRETKESFFVPVEDRSAKTLLNIIGQYVEKGSIIHTGSWAGYDNLSTLGYTHITVNHSDNSVNPSTSKCTKTIECPWWSFQRSLANSHTRKVNVGQHLAEFIWRQKRQGEGSKYLFQKMLEDISMLYPTL